MQNKTHVLILQHQRERSHPFNTARIVSRALSRSKLICGRNEDLGRRTELPLRANAALLYPGHGTRLLSDLDADERPDQLVVLDGTWHQAKTLLRDIRAIRDLPRYCLAPVTPGQYRIRLEPTETSLSTVEATVAALKVLEPETVGFDGLINCFNTMVEMQLAHPMAQYEGRILEKRNPELPNIPHSIIHDLGNIVVAYGESAGGEWSEPIVRKRRPVYWVAQRIGTGEIFRSPIHYDERQPSSETLAHLELNLSDFHDSVSLETFSHRWREFIQESDTLAVYNQSTIDLLRNVGMEVGPRLVLKSVKVNVDRRNGALENVLNSNAIPNETPSVHGRADRRLAAAVAFVKYLNKTGHQRVYLS